MIEIRRLDVHELDPVLALRHEVLDVPVGIIEPTGLSDGDKKEGVIHVAAFDGDNVVSAVRIDPVENTVAHIRRMATRPEYQGKGIGRLVLETAEDYAIVGGACSLSLHAREGAVAFYERIGFLLTGEVFVHHGQPNPEMIKKLDRSGILESTNK